NLAVNVGQSEIAAGVAEGQLLVVETQEMHDRRLQVVDVDGVLGDVETQLIGRPMGDARPDAAAGHPHGEGLWMMIATKTAPELRDPLRRWLSRLRTGPGGSVEHSARCRRRNGD